MSTHLVNSPGGGVISEILPNLQRHKEYLVGQDRARVVPSDLAVRGNPTPPDTPTPPSDLHPHGRQSSRMAIPPDYNAYLQHQMMFAAHNIPYPTGLHPDLMAASFLGMGSPYVPGNFKQPVSRLLCLPEGENFWFLSSFKSKKLTLKYLEFISKCLNVNLLSWNQSRGSPLQLVCKVVKYFAFVTIGADLGLLAQCLKFGIKKLLTMRHFLYKNSPLI